jgi:hypothetical protein
MSNFDFFENPVLALTHLARRMLHFPRQLLSVELVKFLRTLF